MVQTDQTIKMWAIIDLYGHQQIAGLVTEQTIASQGFIRVDVPATDGQPAYTRLFGSGAIYAIQPTDEETVHKFLAYRHEPPINPYILEAHTRSHVAEDEEDHFEEEDRFEEDDEEDDDLSDGALLGDADL